MKFIIALIALYSFSNVSASEIRLEKVRYLGAMKNKVIFQSSDVKYVQKSNLVKGKIVIRWGTEVFEAGNAYYVCDSNKFCKFVDYERQAMFKSCVVKYKKVTCSGQISGDSDFESNDVLGYGNPDEISDSTINNSPDDLNEFPARIQDEYSDIF